MSYILFKQSAVRLPKVQAPETLPVGIGPYKPEWLGFTAHPDFQRMADTTGTEAPSIIDTAPRPRYSVTVPQAGILRANGTGGTMLFFPRAINGKNAVTWTSPRDYSWQTIGNSGSGMGREIFRNISDATILVAFNYTVNATRRLLSFASTTNTARFSVIVLADGSMGMFTKRLDSDTQITTNSGAAIRPRAVWTVAAWEVDYVNAQASMWRDEQTLSDHVAIAWAGGAGNSDTTLGTNQSNVGQTEAAAANAGFAGQIAYIAVRRTKLHPTERMWWMRSIAARLGTPLM